MSPKPRLDHARVRSQRAESPGFNWLELELPADYPEILPGQYLNLRMSSALFRRPFGVVGFKRESSCTLVELFYAVIGEGTREMAAWRPGDSVDCLGPLGRPYGIDASRPALLLAGGRGAAPLLFLYRLLREQGHGSVQFVFGVRTRNLLFGLERIDAVDLAIASDDGSIGFPGTVLEALEQSRPEWLRAQPVLYACGPAAFLAATGRFALRMDLACQVSLEGFYGCGLGLCRGCAVPLVDRKEYLMQCVEGPVVDAHRVDWDRMPHV